MPRHRATPGNKSGTRSGGRKSAPETAEVIQSKAKDEEEAPKHAPADKTPDEPITDKGGQNAEEQIADKKGDTKRPAGKRPAEEEPSGGEQPLGLKRQKLATGRHGIVMGPRIPFQYFVTQGFGDTDEGAGSDPYETGSYDMALEMAHIHQFNIIQYTSVLPPEAVEVPRQNAEPTFMHGAVLETIMSVMHGTKGDRICAGIGRIHVRRKHDNYVIGGYAAEYKGHATAAEATKALQQDLRGIVKRRYSPDEYEGFDEKYTVQEHEVEKSYGTVLTAICFISFIMPEIDPAET